MFRRQLCWYVPCIFGSTTSHALRFIPFKNGLRLFESFPTFWIPPFVLRSPDAPIMPVLQVLLSAFSFFLSALVLTPLTCYFRASNIAAMAVGGWLSVVNVIYAVDALIWATDANIKVPLWCDICTSLLGLQPRCKCAYFVSVSI